MTVNLTTSWASRGINDDFQREALESVQKISRIAIMVSLAVSCIFTFFGVDPNTPIAATVASSFCWFLAGSAIERDRER